MQNREQRLTQWLNTILGHNTYTRVPLTGDASFRHYSRIFLDHQTQIVMDAPPEHENSDAFIRVSRVLQTLGITTPDIIAEDLEQGFLLLSDLGDRILWPELQTENCTHYYTQAFSILVKMQRYQASTADHIPAFDPAHIKLELSYFVDWFLNRYLNISLNSHEQHVVNQAFSVLQETATTQPQTFMHRDFHSKNLMIYQDHLAVLDFQDAMIGPITYDLVSLLKDCYIDWPAVKIEMWVTHFFEILRTEKLVRCDLEQFIYWFHLIGLQRHLKVLGIFTRLYLRDQKPGYLQYLPRVFRYVEEVVSQFAIFNDFYQFLCETVKPKLKNELPNLG